jgi:hypothetical protein
MKPACRGPKTAVNTPPNREAPYLVCMRRHFSRDSCFRLASALVQSLEVNTADKEAKHQDEAVRAATLTVRFILQHNSRDITPNSDSREGWWGGMDLTGQRYIFCAQGPHREKSRAGQARRGQPARPLQAPCPGTASLKNVHDGACSRATRPRFPHKVLIILGESHHMRALSWRGNLTRNESRSSRARSRMSRVCA